MPVIDDFEDGNVSDWDENSGSDGTFNVSQNAISGAWSGNLSISTNGTAIVSREDFIYDDSYRIVFFVRVDTLGNNGDVGIAAVGAESDGSFGGSVDVAFTGAGDIEVNGNAATTFSPSTVYRVDFAADFSASRDVDVYVDGAKVSTVTINDFNSPTDWGGVELTASSDGDTFAFVVDDIQAAIPPTPPTLTQDAARGTEVDLSWTDEGANSYNVYRAQSSGSTTGDYTLIAEPTSTSYTDSGLENGEQYYYRVTGESGLGESDPSNEASATTGLPASDPSASSPNQGEIALSWTKQDNSSDGEWEVYRSEDGSLGTLVADGLAPGTTSYTDSALEDGERFFYTLRRVTDHAQADGAQVGNPTLLPAPSAVSLDPQL